MSQYIFPNVYTADSDLVHTVFYICDKLATITDIKYDYIFKDVDGLVVAWDNNNIFLSIFNKTVTETEPELYINVYDRVSIYPKLTEHLYTYDKDTAVKVLSKHLIKVIRAKL